MRRLRSNRRRDKGYGKVEMGGSKKWGRLVR